MYGFEKALVGLKLGGKSRRSKWRRDSYIKIDGNSGWIHIHYTSTQGKPLELRWDSNPEDLVAEDWEPANF